MFNGKCQRNLRVFLLSAGLLISSIAFAQAPQIIKNSIQGGTIEIWTNASGTVTKKGEIAADGTLKIDKITNAAGTGQPEGGVPVGAIMAFGAATCPTGWVAADGVAKATVTYPALDAYFGITWGARSGGNFQIPNLNGDGRYLRGGTVGTLQAFSTSASGLTAAASAVTGSVSGTTGNDSPDHTHTFNWPDSTLGSPGTKEIGLGTYTLHTTVTATSGASARHTHSFSASLTSGVASGQVISGAAETRPITAVVNFCIKY